MASLCVTFENSRISHRGAAVSRSTHVSCKHNTHQRTTLWTNANNSALVKTKFITIDRGVKIKGHKQEEGNEYAV